LPQALTEADTTRVTQTVDRGLAWLVTQVDREGAFAGGARTNGQPALTSLSIMAFLSRGHRPGVGPYGDILNRAIDFALTCQKPSGLICYGQYDAEMAFNASDTYNHAITMLMLGEVYGMTVGERAIRVRQAIEKGLAFTHALWISPKSPAETGGWRYLHQRFQSDLSVTGWYCGILAFDQERGVRRTQISDGPYFGVRRAVLLSTHGVTLLIVGRRSRAPPWQ
jgi:hypothetical protein